MQHKPAPAPIRMGMSFEVGHMCALVASESDPRNTSASSTVIGGCNGVVLSISATVPFSVECNLPQSTAPDRFARLVDHSKLGIAVVVIGSSAATDEVSVDEFKDEVALRWCLFSGTLVSDSVSFELSLPLSSMLLK